ncbi:hypothetical protein FHR92_003936 [Fontibacillus solani]|uniref:Uncharacterized protein n=1 Tax=Fontibacillus solani TaxID=1572857 RepID=A0A7W3SWC1_9BACL|nr:hypothetical protein [Fontibacillus solani]MBA9087451.1 hypothetical protein [Fontibacillus solani]
MNNIRNWILEDETPEVKYRAMTELLCMKKDEPEVIKAYDSLLVSDTVSLIMDKFKLNNKWEDINACCTLAEIGLTRVDVPIDGYIERIIKNMNLSMKCAKILLLRNLVSLGYYEHSWVKEQIFLAFSTIREDGTFRCLDKTKKTNDSKLPEMGCYRQTTTYLLLAAELKKISVVLPQFELLTEFYINYHVAFRPDDYEKVIIEEMTGTFYPIDHVHIGLQMIMYGLSILGVANHPNCEKAWALLDSKKDSEGKYILSESFAEPYFNVGKVGNPNKWVTLYALLSEKHRRN